MKGLQASVKKYTYMTDMKAVVKFLAAKGIIQFLRMGQVDVMKGILDVGYPVRCAPDALEGEEGLVEAADDHVCSEVVERNV